ncbi:MAG TPA: SDR family NAD(P)-dependent oxidoreductase [Baekduia sp.]|jgi:NAD(P)-dependent dehydrogenase (short-subunit alcohol dehydrogenase family)
MDRLKFDGRVMVVTGAGRGMGAAHAAELAARGAKVMVNDLGGDMFGEGASSEPAEQMAQQIRAAGGDALANGDDVSTAEGCASLISSAVDAFGRLDGVVHNAGIARFTPIAETDEPSFDEVLRVHLHGGFNLTQQAWPHLAQRGGSIVYITSGAGLYGVPTLVGYAAAKVGLVGLMRCAATEGNEAGIRVNALAVAAATRMMDWMEDTPNLHAWFQRYMKPELPAAAAVSLLHQDCTATGRIFEAFGPHMAEVLIAETSGFTKLDMTAEDFTEHLDQITARDGLIFPDGPDDFHGRMFGFAMDAGAEPFEPDAEQAPLITVADDHQ